MAPRPACVARTGSGLPHRNTLVLGPALELEYFVHDIPSCGVACRAELSDGGGEAFVDSTGSAGQSKETYGSGRRKRKTVVNRKLTVLSSRMKVMEKASGKELSKTMKGDAVAYRETYYPTERQYAFVDVVETEGDFDSKKSQLQHKAGSEHNVNEVLVSWDPDRQKVSRFAIDGEEFEL